MANDPKRIYWDSCVFIDRIQETADRINVLRAISKLAEDRDVILVTSAVAIAEVVRCEPDRALSEQDAKKIREFFENDYITVRQLTTDIAGKAAEISPVQGRTPLDAIHVATAIDAKCLVLHTYDGRNKKKKGKLLPFNGKIGRP